MQAGKRNPINKSRARPPTGTDLQIGTRWPAVVVAAIDAWRKNQETLPGRSEAIRRLVEIGLAVQSVRKQTGKSRQRAAELAGDVLDTQADQTASPQQRDDRKRRLLKGPSVFREMRKDRAK